MSQASYQAAPRRHIKRLKVGATAHLFSFYDHTENLLFLESVNEDSASPVVSQTRPILYPDVARLGLFAAIYGGSTGIRTQVSSVGAKYKI